MNTGAADLHVELFPESGDSLDSDWQEECRRLVARLKGEIPNQEAELVTDTRTPSGKLGEGTRALDAALFSSFFIFVQQTGMLDGLAGRLCEILNQWLERRKGCRCVIKFPDGSEFTFDNLSKDELLSIMKTHRSL